MSRTLTERRRDDQDSGPRTTARAATAALGTFLRDRHQPREDDAVFLNK